jgi:hypothetical protein
VPVILAGEGHAAVVAIYAALLEPDISELILRDVPTSHMAPNAPALLNVLRVCDIPEALGMVAPRPVTVLETGRSWTRKTAEIYKAAGAADKLRGVGSN